MLLLRAVSEPEIYAKCLFTIFQQFTLSCYESRFSDYHFSLNVDFFPHFGLVCNIIMTPMEE